MQRILYGVLRDGKVVSTHDKKSEAMRAAQRPIKIGFYPAVAIIAKFVLKR